MDYLSLVATKHQVHVDLLLKASIEAFILVRLVHQSLRSGNQELTVDICEHIGRLCRLVFNAAGIPEAEIKSKLNGGGNNGKANPGVASGA